MSEDDKRKLFYAEVLLKSVSGENPTWLALGPFMWPMLKEALSDYISKIKENKMCKFCDLLYSEKQANNKLHNKGVADLVYFDDNGELNIQVDTGDPWESGILSNITFCPYCGRNLKELYGPFIRGVLKEDK